MFGCAIVRGYRLGSSWYANNTVVRYLRPPSDRSLRVGNTNEVTRGYETVRKRMSITGRDGSADLCGHIIATKGTPPPLVRGKRQANR